MQLGVPSPSLVEGGPQTWREAVEYGDVSFYRGISRHVYTCMSMYGYACLRGDDTRGVASRKGRCISFFLPVLLFLAAPICNPRKTDRPTDTPPNSCRHEEEDKRYLLHGDKRRPDKEDKGEERNQHNRKRRKRETENRRYSPLSPAFFLSALPSWL